MGQCISEERNMIITDGYNNLYRLEQKDGDCLMYEHSTTLHLTIPVEVSYDILNNPFYSELWGEDYDS